MARYLCAHGAAGDLRRALFAYNHAEWYVNECSRSPCATATSPPAPRAHAVLDLARAQTGKPYVWGGASPQTSFDCSGLVQWVYRQVGVALPRTAQQQYERHDPRRRGSSSSRATWSSSPRPTRRPSRSPTSASTSATAG